MKTLYVILLILAFSALIVAAQPNKTEELPEHEVLRTAEDIKVDGRLDEAVWSMAPGITLRFPWEDVTQEKQSTIVKLLWDDDNLYVGYDCQDTEITAVLDTHDDPVYRDDCVEIFISPDEQRVGFYYGLEMNCRAVLFDYFKISNGPIIKKLDMRQVKLATDLRGTLNVAGDEDEGWSLEVAIPFENFTDMVGNVPPKPGALWRINLNRLDGVQPHRELSMWSPSGTEKPNFHVPERFGVMVFSGQTP